jgi:hypothetical protein
MTAFYGGIDLHSNNSVVVVMDEGCASPKLRLLPFGPGISARDSRIHRGVSLAEQ